VAEKLYRGIRLALGGTLVTVDGGPLNLAPSLDIWCHSPTGFDWGYSGSGPAQLALAILLDVTAAEWVAVALHQRFKAELVAKWDRKEDWTLTSAVVISWILDQVETNQFQRAKEEQISNLAANDKCQEEEEESL
jgi:Family of unknown function (DUF6166)